MAASASAPGGDGGDGSRRGIGPQGHATGAWDAFLGQGSSF